MRSWMVPGGFVVLIRLEWNSYSGIYRHLIVATRLFFMMFYLRCHLLDSLRLNIHITTICSAIVVILVGAILDALKFGGSHDAIDAFLQQRRQRRHLSGVAQLLLDEFPLVLRLDAFDFVQRVLADKRFWS